MSTHTRTQAASAGSKACNHRSDLKGEFYRERRDRYLPIRLPVSTSNKSREQETRQHRQVVGRSAALWFDVCESAHQCVEPASSWHAGSPAASPLAAHGWLSHCRSEWGCCFPRWEDGSFPASWASFFFPLLFFLIGPQLWHLAGLLWPTCWWWGGELVQTRSFSSSSSASSCQSWAHVVTVFSFATCGPLPCPLHSWWAEWGYKKRAG